MRTISLLLVFMLSVVLFTACSSESNEVVETEMEGTFYGEAFELTNIVQLASIIDSLSEEESEVIRVEGTVVQVCQTKGCWMTLESETDNNVRVTFLDYGFFVPKDMAGSTIVAEGRAWVEKKSVNTLRHYAEDAGKSAEEIAAITEDSVEYLFEASGVFLR
jgi:hypothetical protein